MLEELIATKFDGDWRELLGELQLAFVLFLQLSSLAALEQWKQVSTTDRSARNAVDGSETHRRCVAAQFVALLCSCERALESHSELIVAFLKVFRAQMEQVWELPRPSFSPTCPRAHVADRSSVPSTASSTDPVGLLRGRAHDRQLPASVPRLPARAPRRGRGP